MIDCKRHIIAIGFILLLPVTGWSEAPVVDDSENFATIEEQRAHQASVVNSKYDETYPSDGYQDEDGPALAKDDQLEGHSNKNISDNATLVDKVQSVQQEVQELRGQLEVQAHDLKLLQQQQLAFYKDLDSRLGGATAIAVKTAPNKPAMDLSLGSNEPAKASHAVKVEPVPVSRVNIADEQISYLAAYELVKNKQYDNALNAMDVFVQKFPKGGYTANAQYWLGELYLLKKDYAQSIEHFDVVLQQFPTSSKSAASMLKVGYAYAAMGNKSEAKKFLQQVVRAYPNTPTAQLANSKLRAI